ncbi:sigma-70 family RNA polymerase sigma factor [bacterium]|nr:sigma-70 family RNA polymerase sigma factor [bacterium]
MSLATQTDTSWSDLARRAHGEAGALDDLLHRVRPFVYALILDRIRRPEVAEDLTQEALTDVVRGLPGLHDPSALTAWLRRIALNRCRQYWRQVERDFGELEDDVAGAATNDAYTLTAQRETWRQLCRALEALPEPSRLALLMHVLGDCTYREIAAALGESEVGVRVRVHRARQRLRELVRPSFYDPEER